MISADASHRFSYNYLFKLSYLYGVVIGFLLTFIIGYLLSYILILLNKQGPERIYVDDTKTIMRAELFMPPKAKYIRRRNAVFERAARKDSINKY